MANWTNKQWGAIIGALLVFAVALLGAGITALAVLAGIAGYLIGKFLDGELDLEEIRARAQGRTNQGDQANTPGAAPSAGFRTGPAANQPSGRVR